MSRHANRRHSKGNPERAAAATARDAAGKGITRPHPRFISAATWEQLEGMTPAQREEYARTGQIPPVLPDACPDCGMHGGDPTGCGWPDAIPCAPSTYFPMETQ